MGVDDLGQLALDQAEQVHVALAELVGQVAELPLCGGVGRGRRCRRLLAVALQVVVDFVEAVHVQLADEGRDVGVFEVLSQHVGELFAGVEAEGVVGGGPPDEVGQQQVLQHVVELVDEHGLGLGRGGARSGWRGRGIVRELGHRQRAVRRVWGGGGGGLVSSRVRVGGVSRIRVEHGVGQRSWGWHRAGGGQRRRGAVGAASDGHGDTGGQGRGGGEGLVGEDNASEKQVRAQRGAGRGSCRRG